MKRSRKIILIALLTLVVIGGSIGGVALAQTDNGDDSPPKARYGALLERACEIYQEETGVTIDADKLTDALTQAGEEKMVEARNQFRQRLIDEGKITQEQLDELDKWLESKPDVPIIPGLGGDFGPHGFRMHGGGFHRFGGPCAPQAPTE
jgi:hypothetical protein